MGPLLAAAIPGMLAAAGSLAGSAISNAGQAAANKANAAEAAKNRAWQEQMSNTSYQRAVEDMKKAGLNPALAYQQGGAGTPGGATAAPMQNTRVGYATGAMQAAETAAGIAQIKANVRKTDAETNQLNLESAARLAQIQATAANLQSMTAFRNGPQVNNLNMDTRNKDAAFKGIATNSEYAERHLTALIAKMWAEKMLTDVNARLGRQDLMHEWFARNIAPFVNDAGSFTQLVPMLGTILRGRGRGVNINKTVTNNSTVNTKNWSSAQGDIYVP